MHGLQQGPSLLVSRRPPSAAPALSNFGRGVCSLPSASSRPAHGSQPRPPQALRRCATLRRLQLRACPLGDKGLQALASSLSASKIQELRLECCGLDDRSVSVVLSIAKAHRDRRDAAAWTGTLRAQDAPSAQQSEISGDGLILLSLCDNAITDRGASQLASHLNFGWIQGAARRSVVLPWLWAFGKLLHAQRLTRSTLRAQRSLSPATASPIAARPPSPERCSTTHVSLRRASKSRKARPRRRMAAPGPRRPSPPAFDLRSPLQPANGRSNPAALSLRVAPHARYALSRERCFSRSHSS